MWWSPWTPTGPCPSTRQIKWRSIATGTSMNLVHTCESITLFFSKKQLSFYIRSLRLEHFLFCRSINEQVKKTLQISRFKALWVWMCWAGAVICLLKIQCVAKTSVRIINLEPVTNGEGWGRDWDQRDPGSCVESQSGASAGHSEPWHAICPLATLSQCYCEAAKIKQSPTLVN